MPQIGNGDLAVMHNHLEESEVARFADRRVTAEERERILSHLSECVTCRSEVRAIRSITVRRRWRRGLSIGVPAVAAAGLAFLMFSAGPSNVDGTALRDSGSEQSLTALLPEDNAVVEGDSVAFRWDDEGGRGPYVLTLSDLSGLTVHNAATDVPYAMVPMSVLERGASYLWYVDGLMSDGERSTTGVRRFRVRR